jgi:hypothetical protein
MSVWTLAMSGSWNLTLRAYCILSHYGKEEIAGVGTCWILEVRVVARGKELLFDLANPQSLTVN